MDEHAASDPVILDTSVIWQTVGVQREAEQMAFFVPCHQDFHQQQEPDYY